MTSAHDDYEKWHNETVTAANAVIIAMGEVRPLQSSSPEEVASNGDNVSSPATEMLIQQSVGITRFEVIGPEGRQIVHHGEVTMQLQDNGRTLKVFTKSSVKLLEWEKEAHHGK